MYNLCCLKITNWSKIWLLWCSEWYYFSRYHYKPILFKDDIFFLWCLLYAPVNYIYIFIISNLENIAELTCEASWDSPEGRMVLVSESKPRYRSINKFIFNKYTDQSTKSSCLKIISGLRNSLQNHKRVTVCRNKQFE
jgi:hypothetical protein